MTKAELKRLTTGALGAVWRGPPSRGWCFFSIHLGECMGYGGPAASTMSFIINKLQTCRFSPGCILNP